MLILSRVSRPILMLSAGYKANTVDCKMQATLSSDEETLDISCVKIPF